MARIAQPIAVLLAFVLASSVVGCATEAVRRPVPTDQHEAAELVDIPGVRAWGDEHSELFQRDLVHSMRTENPEWFARGGNGEFEYAALALSGGGDHGAFGAGFLKGWSQSGHRPRFKIVTGISTGALMAPFAMLGADYDPILQEAYTTISASDVFEQKSILEMWRGEAIADNHPLEILVHKVVTDEVINAVGEAHRNGQRMYVGTTNLDAQRSVIWNMGAIADSQHPQRHEVFRKILIASAAIPILFPPVFIDVEINDEPYDEMHVDGGTMGQLFFLGSTVDWNKALREASGTKQPVDNSVYYAIVDGEIDPNPKNVERRLKPIAIRTIGTVIKVSAWSSLYRMFLHAESRGYQLLFVGLPDDFEPMNSEPYNQADMKRMFDIGLEMGRSGDAWRSSLPGF